VGPQTGIGGVPTDARMLSGFGSLANFAFAYILENLIAHLRPPKVSSYLVKGFMGIQMPSQS